MKHHHHHNLSSSAAETAVSSSSAYQSQSPVQPPSSATSSSSSSSSAAAAAATTSEKPVAAAEDAAAASRDAVSVTTAASESVTVERRGEYAAVCKWAIANFPRIKGRALWSKYFEVGGYDCRLLVYPKGDSQALPGYISIYLQIMDPRNTTSAKWDCFASYRLAIENPTDASKSIHRDSWHRFSSKKKSHGWCDFTPSNSILDQSKDTEKTLISDRSCWCLFRMSVLNQKPGMNHVHRDSYGRFAADNKSGDNTSLGWNDYMKMSDFVGSESGYLVDDTAVFSTSFHVIKELSSFSKNGGVIGARIGNSARKSDGHLGKFTWRIENFTRLKDLLKKRKITGLCIKSRRFQIGNRDCRLIVYPRGQAQPPCHLSVFLEVTDSRNTNNDWSCFVSHRLSVVNQRIEEKSVTKESQNRYSKAAKDWGWREFVTLTSLFDQDSGFLVQDTVLFVHLKRLLVVRWKILPFALRRSGQSSPKSFLD
nr:MATH domain and coiled-coil domain-containing protein [Ipomoea batatas]